MKKYIDSRELKPGLIQWIRGIGKTGKKAAAMPEKEITELLTHSDYGGKRSQQAFEAIKQKFEEVATNPSAKKELIKKLMDPTKVKNNILNKSNDSVVTAAMRHGHKDIVALLEANGVDVETAQRTNNKGKIVTVSKNHKANSRRYYKSEKAAVAAGAAVVTIAAVLTEGAIFQGGAGVPLGILTPSTGGRGKSTNKRNQQR
jgi:hypothetical protein